MKHNFLLILLAFILQGCSSKILDKIEPLHRTKKFHLVWTKNLDPKDYETGNLPIGFSAPFIHAGLLYQPTKDGYLNVYDLENGRMVWQMNENQPLGAPVTLFGDYIYYGGYEGRFFVRHYLTGELKYSIDLGAPIESSPVFYEGRAIIHLRNHKIVAMDQETGKILWTYKRAVTQATTLQRVSKILAVDKKLYIGFADGFVGALNLEEGLLLWETKIAHAPKFIDVDNTPLMFNGKLIVGAATGPLSFVDPNTGLIEKTIPMAPGHTPLVYEGKLYVGSMDGHLYVLSSEGIPVITKKISRNGISSITPWKDGLAIGFYGGKIHFLDKKSLEIKEKFALGSPFSSVFGNLVESKGYLAVYSSRNRLYVFH